MAPRTSPPNLPLHVLHALSLSQPLASLFRLGVLGQTGIALRVFSCQEAVTDGRYPARLHRLPAARTLCSTLSPAPGCVHERGALLPWDGTSVFWVDILPDRCRAKRNKPAPWAESFISAVGFAKTGWEMAGVKKQSKRTNDSGHSLFSVSHSVFSAAKHRAALTQGIDSVTEMLVCSHQRDRSEVLNDSIALLLRACQHSQSHKTDFSAPVQS